MINLFRSFASSLAAKIFLSLVVLSFIVAGGIGAGSLSKNNVASVGDLNISYSDFYSEYQRRLQSMNLTNSSKEELRQLDFARGVLDGIIARKLVQAETQDLNLTISDSYLANTIKQTEYFQKDGKFDKATFKSILRSNGYSEESYVTLLENDIVSERYTRSLTSIGLKASNLSRLIARTSEQKRSGLIASKPINIINEKDANSDTLNTYYNENRDNFRKPEVRDITTILLSANILKKSITDAQAKEVYSISSETYRIPETRSYYAFTGKKSNLEKLVRAVKKPADLQNAVKTILKKPLSAFLKKDVRKDSIPPYVASLVFKTRKNTFSEVSAGAFDTSVVWVKSITPSHIPNFASVKNKIKSYIAEEKLLDSVNTAEDAVSAGAQLEEISKTLGIKTTSITALSVNGNTISFTQDPAFIKEVFETPKGETTMAIELANNQYALVHVKSIKESHIPSLNSIKDEVQNSYKKFKARTTLQKQLDTLSDAKSVTQFKELAKKLKFKTSMVTELSREGAYKSEINAMLFENALNSANNTIIRSKGYAIFTTNINTPKKASPDRIKNTNTTLENIAQSSAYKAIIDALKEKHSVTINHTALNSVYQ